MLITELVKMAGVVWKEFTPPHKIGVPIKKSTLHFTARIAARPFGSRFSIMGCVLDPQIQQSVSNISSRIISAAGGSSIFRGAPLPIARTGSQMERRMMASTQERSGDSTSRHLTDREVFRWTRFN